MDKRPSGNSDDTFVRTNDVDFEFGQHVGLTAFVVEHWEAIKSGQSIKIPFVFRLLGLILRMIIIVLSV